MNVSTRSEMLNRFRCLQAAFAAVEVPGSMGIMTAEKKYERIMEIAGKYIDKVNKIKIDDSRKETT